MSAKTSKIQSRMLLLTALLILFTFIQIGYIFGVFFADDELLRLTTQYNLYTILFLVNIGMVGLFITFIWMYMPDSRKEKTNHSFMILFLGVIGMWMWRSHAKSVLRNANQTNSEL